MTLTIRPAILSDLPDLMRVHREAFGGDAEADLTNALLQDSSGAPRISLAAIQNNAIVGHVLLTRLSVDDRQNGSAILCPLAIVPDAQGQGAGGLLIRAAQAACADMGIDTICVLGDPEYYGRFGFVTAIAKGLLPPFPLPPEYHTAWQVWPDHTERNGQCRAADALMKPGYWNA